MCGHMCSMGLIVSLARRRISTMGDGGIDRRARLTAPGLFPGLVHAARLAALAANLAIEVGPELLSDHISGHPSNLGHAIAVLTHGPIAVAGQLAPPLVVHGINSTV